MITQRIRKFVNKIDEKYNLILVLLLVISIAVIIFTLCGCPRNIVYIPGEDESQTPQVVYFIKKGQPSPIDGIVLSKAKFYRFAKKATLEVKESEEVLVVPVKEGAP